VFFIPVLYDVIQSLVEGRRAKDGAA